MQKYSRRDAVHTDLPRIVDIYNCAILKRESVIIHSNNLNLKNPT